MDSNPGQPASPPQAHVDGSLRRAQAKLDFARRRLARAERDRVIADSRRMRLLRLAGLRRTQANRLREHEARAQKRADAAEAQMVGERRDALKEVQVRRAAHSMELLNWLGRRITAFSAAVWLLLMAFLAAGWRPMVGWLALRRASGLDGVTYAKATAVVAATAGGGAAAVSGLSRALSGALSPVAIPVIAAGVILTGSITWCASTVKVGSAGAPVSLADRRLVPGMAVALTLVVGLGIGLIGILEGEPAEQPVAPKTAALARLAEPDPTAHPTKHVARLRSRAERANTRARRAEARTATAQSMLRNFDLP